MLNKYIIGELFEIAQEYVDGNLEFAQQEMVKDRFLYKEITLFAENCKLTILNKENKYIITVRTNNYVDILDCLSESQTLHLLYSFKKIYDNCTDYPNAVSNALIQMCSIIYEQMKEQH